MCRWAPGTASRAAALASTLVAALALAGCPGPTDDTPFPADFETAWTEARTPCTLSHDHELTYIRVFADDAALGPYSFHDAPYPVGARLLKVEYMDEACTEIVDYVLMERLAAGAAPSELDWRWLRFDRDRRPITDRRFEPETCINCHTCHCGMLPYGWELTCSVDGIEPPGGCSGR